MSLEDKLKEIKTRCEAATEGPWTPYTSKNGMYSEVQVWEKGEYIYTLALADGHVDRDRENFELMAHARTDVPMLLEMVEDTINHVQALVGNTGQETLVRKLEKIAEKYRIDT